MMQGLTRRLDAAWVQARRHRLDALALSRQQQPQDVLLQRRMPVLVLRGNRQAVRVGPEGFLFWAWRGEAWSHKTILPQNVLVGASRRALPVPLQLASGGPEYEECQDSCQNYRRADDVAFVGKEACILLDFSAWRRNVDLLRRRKVDRLNRRVADRLRLVIDPRLCPLIRRRLLHDGPGTLRLPAHSPSERRNISFPRPWIVWRRRELLHRLETLRRILLQCLENDLLDPPRNVRSERRRQRRRRVGMVRCNREIGTAA